MSHHLSTQVLLDGLLVSNLNIFFALLNELQRILIYSKACKYLSICKQVLIKLIMIVIIKLLY